MIMHQISQLLYGWLSILFMMVCGFYYMNDLVIACTMLIAGLAYITSIVGAAIEESYSNLVAYGAIHIILLLLTSALWVTTFIFCFVEVFKF